MTDSAGIHVLHVDDEPDFAELTAEMLEREFDRFTVETATSASEGLDRFAVDDFDCIVSDYDMPGQDGIEFLEHVRDEYPALPFILYTGKGSEEVASDAIAAGVTDYLQKGAGTDQYELLANRIQNAVEQYRATERAAELDRIRTLASDINQALVHADSRSQTETRVCEIISDSDPYLFAWIGEVDPDTDRIEPRAWAGVEEDYLTDISVTADDTPTGQGPGGTAIRERRVAVTQNVHEDPEFEPWRDEALERGYQAVAAVPLEYEDTLYGELVVYADRPHAFDDKERALLADLGSDIARAFHSFRIQTTLRRNTRAIDEAPIGITITGPSQEDNPLVYFNDRFEELTGYDREEIIGRNCRFLQGEGTDTEPVAELRQAIDTQEPVTVELRNYRKDGTEFWNRVTIAPAKNDDGEITNWVGFQQDVTERKERERELERERNRFKTLFEGIPEPVVSATLTDDGTILRDVNDAFEETFGYDASEAIGQDINDLIVPDEASMRSEAEQIDERAKTGEQLTTEVRRETGDGLRDFLFRSAPIEQDDGETHQFGVYIDITERTEHRRRLETLIDTLPGMVYQCDNERGWPMETVEGEVEALTGYTPTEIEEQTGIYGEEIIHPDDRETVWTAVQEALDADESFELTYRIRTKDGETKWVWERGRRVSTDSGGGDVATLEGFITDITERKQRERQLERYETIVEASGDPVVTLDEDGQITFVNDAMVELTGYEREHLIGNDPSVVVEPADIEQATQVVRSLLSTSTERDTFELTVSTADGEQIPCEIHIALLPFDEEFQGTVGIFRDIRERKRREVALNALHDATRDLMDATDKQAVAERAVETARTVLDQPINGLWLHDSDSDMLRPVTMTTEAVELLDEQPTYRGTESLSWQAFTEGDLRVYDDVHTEQGRLNSETPIRSEIIVPLGEHGVMNIGATDPANFTDTDISLARILGKTVEGALTRAEREQQLRSQRTELQRQNERLEKFTSVVSHDLRNPLQVADARLAQAQSECDSTHLDNVADALDRMETLIDDLLTLAQQGEQVQETAVVMLAELVEGCWQSVKTTDGTLVCDTEQRIRADESRLKQLLENLFRNAVEHGGEGVTITVGDLDDGFYVADDGPGIPDDEREEVFEAGYSTADEGTGFGLNIVQEIAEAHGWEITVTDSEASGARFEITGVEFD